MGKEHEYSRRQKSVSKTSTCLPEPVGSAYIVVLWLLQMSCICSLSVQLSRLVWEQNAFCFLENKRVDLQTSTP